MTSRVSFSKLIKPTLKKSYTWFIVSGVYVLINTMYDLLRIQMFRSETLSDMDMYSDLHQNISSLCSPYHCTPQLSLAFVLGACLSLQYFSQFYRRKQADFFGSLPITRKAYWGLSATCSMIIFEIAVVAAVLLRTIIAIGYGGSPSFAIAMSLATLLCSNLSFMLSWLTMTMATVLTGNVIVALMGYLSICMYAPIMIGQLISSYASTFLRTFTGMDTHLYNYLSPMANAFMLNGVEGEYWSFSDKHVLFATILIMIAAFAVIDIKLFEHRALEKAGSAMAFRHSMPIIKFLIAVPIAMAFGLTFMDLSSKSYPWFFVGLVLGSFLANGIIESIYRFDVRGMISSRVHLIGIICISVAISLVFIMDLTGFNSRVPEAGAVKYISITSDNGNDILCAASGYSEGYEEESKGTDLRKAPSDEEKKAMLEYIHYLADNCVDGDSADSKQKAVNVTYKLNNGKEMSRTYAITNNSKYREVFGKMYDRPGFKEQFYEIYSLPDKAVKSASYYDGVNRTRLSLSGKQLQELRKIYEDELSTLDYRTVLNTPYVGTLSFQTSQVKGVVDSKPEFDCYIYPSFRNTLNYLKKAGIDTGSLINKYSFKAFRFTNVYFDSEDAPSVDDSGDEMSAELAYEEGVSVSRSDLESILNLERDLVPAENCRFMGENKYDSLHHITARISKAQTEYLEMCSLNATALQHFID